VRLTSSATNNASLTINSLVLNGASVSGTGTLSITSGGVLTVQPFATIANTLNFGGAEAQFFVVGKGSSEFSPAGLTVSGIIQGSGGLTKSGPGELTLSGANTFTGPLTINENLVLFSAPGNLGVDSSAIVINSDVRRVSNNGFTGLKYTGSTALTLARPIQVNGGIGSVNGANLTLSGAVSGSGGLALLGDVTLTGANSYQGPTRVDGSVTIASDAAFGNGGAVRMENSSSRINLAGNWTTSRLLVLANSATINTAGFNATLNGPISAASGTLIKTGLGELLITTSSSARNAMDIRGGTLRLSGAGALLSSAYTLRDGSDLRLDNGTLTKDRVNNAATVTLDRASLTLLGNGAASWVEVIGALSGTAAGSNGSSTGTVTLTPAGSFSTILAAASLTTNGSDLLFRGASLGAGPAGAFSRVSFGTPPTLLNGIVPGVYVDDSATGPGSSFATYDTASDSAGVIGLRKLALAEYATGAVIQNPANGGSTATTANYLATAATTQNGVRNTVQTLTIGGAGSVTLTAGQQLFLSPSGVLIQPGASGAMITGGALNFGGSAATFFTGGDLTVNSPIVSGAGIKKLGAGTLTLAPATPVPGPVYVNAGKLRFTSTALGTELVYVNRDGTLDLNGSSARVGAVTLSPGGAITLGAGTLTIGAQGLNSSGIGNVSGSGSILVDVPGDGLASLTFSGASAHTGGTVLKAGRVLVGDGAAFGAGTVTVQGGRLKAGATITLANPIVLQSPLVIVGDFDDVINAPSVVTVSGSLSGAHPIELRGGARLAIESAAAYTGETRTAPALLANFDVSSGHTGGELTLRGALGSATASSLFRIEAGGGVVLDNSTAFAGPSAGRIGDTVPIVFGTGTLTLRGHDSALTTERVGAITIAGAGIISMRAGTAGVRLNATSLTRSERGTLELTGAVFGNALGSGVAQVVFDTPPTGAIGAGGSGPNVSVLPYVFGTVNFTGTFATNAGANGLRLLDLATEYAAFPPPAATNNAKIASGTTNNAATVTVNSLTLEFGGNLAGSGTVNITSGGLLSSGLSAISNAINFGAAEGIIGVLGGSSSSELRITGKISGSAGLTKSGQTKLQLFSGNDFTGTLTVHEGVVAFNAESALGAGGGPIVIHGGNAGVGALGYSAGIEYNGIGAGILGRNIQVTSGLGTISALSALNLTGTLSGSGGYKFRVGPFTLANGNTYTGPTIIFGASTVNISDDSALGSGPLIMDVPTGTLRLQGAWTTNRAVEAGGILDTNGFDAVLNGLLVRNEGESGLTKAGAGMLTIGADSGYRASVTVNGGTVRLSGVGAIDASAVAVNAGTQFRLDNTATAVSGRLTRATGITLTGAQFTLLGHASTRVDEQLGVLTLGGTNFSSLTLDSTGSAPLAVSFSSFTPATGSILLRGDNLGGSSGAFTRLVFNTPPTLVGGVLPRVLVDTSAVGFGGSVGTYDSGVDVAGIVGVRPLNAGEYSGGSPIQNPVNGGTTPTTANFLSAAATTAVGTTNTLNTLTLAPASSLTLSAGQSLVLSTGLLVAQTGGASSISGGTLAFGAAPAIVGAAGDLTLNSVITGTGGFAKQGSAALILPAGVTHTFSGTTAVEGGILKVNGTLATASSSPVNVAFGATLSGTGTISRPVTIGGTLSAGDPTGILQTSGITFQAGSTLAIDLNSAASFDQVSVTGGVSLMGSVQLSLSLGYNPQDDVDSFLIVANDGTDAVSGVFAFGGTPLTQGTIFSSGGQLFQITYTGGTGNDVLLIAVPEPQTALVIIAGLAVIGWSRRRETR
jgi:fibronectin-binding autotransporter adhesin